jgi:hypothetical protein
MVLSESWAILGAVLGMMAVWSGIIISLKLRYPNLPPKLMTCFFLKMIFLLTSDLIFL